jgi:hypothetical protein
VIVSEFEDADALRVARATRQPNRMTELLTALDERYRVAATFNSRPRIGPLTWFTRVSPPNDVLYIMPRVRIYERQAE